MGGLIIIAAVVVPVVLVVRAKTASDAPEVIIIDPSMMTMAPVDVDGNQVYIAAENGPESTAPVELT